MDPISWLVLISLSFVVISAAAAFLAYVAFFANEGKNVSTAIMFLLLISVIVSTIFAKITNSPVIPASVIAGSFLVFILGIMTRFLLPSFDNKDAISAMRPIVNFCCISGLAIALFNIVKILI